MNKKNKKIMKLLTTIPSVGHYERVHTMWANYYSGRCNYTCSTAGFIFRYPSN